MILLYAVHSKLIDIIAPLLLDKWDWGNYYMLLCHNCFCFYVVMDMFLCYLFVVKNSIYSNGDLDLRPNDPKISRVLPLLQGNHVVKFGKDPIYRTKVIVRKPVWTPSRHTQSHNKFLTTGSFPHDNFSSVFWIFTKLDHIIAMWKGKNPIYFRGFFPFHRGIMWPSMVKIRYTELKLLCGNLCGRPPTIPNHIIMWKGKNPIYFRIIRSKVKVIVTINRIFDNRVVST
jgi:hypothetical protein